LKHPPIFFRAQHSRSRKLSASKQSAPGAVRGNEKTHSFEWVRFEIPNGPTRPLQPVKYRNQNRYELAKLRFMKFDCITEPEVL
jgi:hypothetical protein